MQASHLKALQEKHEKLEQDIRNESNRAARNEALIARSKKEKLHLKEEIERMQKAGG
jgi:hypothetical protein